ncbi:MAG TPA: hypothetical protein PKI94_07550 [Candidatus Gastranaerophilaceae bacterium]|nr:hypothetical protein [Candidatus Gastranaerophilaceae bacterium]
MKIAILYIGTGHYTIFWDEFFKSCEKYFIKDAQKHYFFFTDSKNFKSDEKITIVPQENLGWPLITCLRYKILNKIKEDLKDYDYAFFFNGNMEFIRKITKEEFLPIEKDGYIVASLHSGNKRVKFSKEFPYERNPLSTSYIPYGVGEKYFHAGILGGRTKEFLELLDTCEKMMDEDLSNNIIPKFHDESVFNKYILNRPYKILSNYYIHPVHGKPFVWLNQKVKIIQRDKSRFKYGGHAYLRGETNKKITPVSYFKEKIKQIFK